MKIEWLEDRGSFLPPIKAFTYWANFGFSLTSWDPFITAFLTF